MRMPVRSETDAFYIAIGFAAVTLAAVGLGALTEPVFGLGLYAVAISAAVGFELFARDAKRRRPLYDAAHTPHPAHDGRWRVLMIADDVPAGHELRDLIVTHAQGAPEIDAVCPVLTSRAGFISTDVDVATGEARERLGRTLAWMRQEGFEGHGEIGDPIDPFAAIETELRRYGADEVIIAVRGERKSSWLENKLLDRMLRELDIPVTCSALDTKEKDRRPVHF